MGIVKAEITLKNVKDALITKSGFMQAQEIRQKTVSAVVDTGAMTMVINEKLRMQLGLEVVGSRQVTLANDAKEIIKIADPVEIHWKNRSMMCQPWVVPGETRILMGLIPLEHMDLMVDPTRQEVVGAHGDEEIGMLF